MSKERLNEIRDSIDLQLMVAKSMGVKDVVAEEEKELYDYAIELRRASASYKRERMSFHKAIYNLDSENKKLNNEIERLSNVINELEKWLNDIPNYFMDSRSNNDGVYIEKGMKRQIEITLNKLKELRGDSNK